VPWVTLVFGETGVEGFSGQLILISSPGASSSSPQFLSFLFSQLLMLVLTNGLGFCLQLIFSSSPGAFRFCLFSWPKF